MDSTDLETLRAALSWIRSGRKALLATVTKTWGSSPRPEGSMMALREDGHVSGSISGGCIEDDLIERAPELVARLTMPEVETYGVSAEEAHRFGLPCGGTIQLVLEPLTECRWIDSLVDGMEGRLLLSRELVMATGKCSVTPAAAGDTMRFDEARLITVHGPRYRLLIIGAGSLSAFLAQVALGLGYEVTVCEPCTQYSDAWNLDGIHLVRAMPDDVVQAMALDERSAVVALTHDTILDDLALMKALNSGAFYVGALGSAEINQKRRERLRQFNLTAGQVDNLRGPIGIHIGSQTPHEIAISVLAELTAARNGVACPRNLGAEIAER